MPRPASWRCSASRSERRKWDAGPTLADYWTQVQQFYPGDRDRRVLTVWLELPHGSSTWGDTRLDVFTRSDCEAAMTARRKQHRRTRSGKATGRRQ